MKARVLCPTCAHQRAIHGNAHIRCNARASDAVMESNPLLSLLAIMNSGGFGWANFDPWYPNPVVECEHYAEATNETEVRG